MTRRLLGPLGVRLAAAFLSVTVVGLAIFALLVLLTDRSDLNQLAQTQRKEATAAVVSALRSAYRANGGWSGADLQPVVALADLSGSEVELDNPAGAVLFRAGARGVLRSDRALVVSRSVDVEGAVVGHIHLTFPAQGLSPAELHLRSSLVRSAGYAAALAVVVALVVTVAMTRVLVRPLRRLSVAARALGAGDRGARVGPRAGPGELGELGATFNAMAASLDRQEQLRQVMVADVAHELRTPVAVLQAETESLVDGVRSPSREALGSLHDETLRLGRMVEDLQALASADAAGLTLQRHPVDLAQVAIGAADALSGRFQSAEIAFDRSVSPVVVWADAHRLHQVITNLLANASKFTPPGGQVHLDVRGQGDLARIEVCDSGPGVIPAERERVFDRFFRGSAGRASGGTGIGLAVVKQLVEAHGGQVSLHSPPGGGACFVVLLPASGMSARR